MNVQFFITMAGQSSRFKLAGYHKHKALLPILGVPILEYLIRQLRPFGEVNVIVNEEDHARVDYNLTNLITSLDARELVIPSHRLGPSYSVHLVRNEIDPDAAVIVHYCDVGGVWDINSALESLLTHDGFLLGFTGFHPHMARSKKFAYAELDHNKIVRSIKEKESYSEQPEREFASSGIYGFKSGHLLLEAIDLQFEYKIAHSNEYYTSLTYVPLINSGKNIVGIEMDKFFNWGTPEDYEDFVYYSRNVSHFKNTSFESKIPGNGVLMAGGGSTRLIGDGDVSKQLLEIYEKPLWEYSLEFLALQPSILVARKPLANRILPSEKVHIAELNFDSKSSIESALYGLNNLKSSQFSRYNFKEVSLLCTDNLLGINHLNLRIASDLLLENDILVWTAQNYPRASIDPLSFSWLRVGDDLIIDEVVFKGRPNNFVDWSVITGNFTFSSYKTAIKILTGALDLVESESKEIHLEYIIPLAIKMGYRVFALPLDYYLSVGTFEEYKVATYWDGVFK
jgi:dTDP-glucose pyrophosphorylase